MLRPFRLAALLAALLVGGAADAVEPAPAPLAWRMDPPALPGARRLLAPVGYNTVVVAPDRYGHYTVQGRINNQRVIDFIIDTGASVVLLGRSHAEALRLYPRDRSKFTAEARTANGVIKLAPVVLDEIRIERLSVVNVPALVSENDQEVALLGMNFLRQLRRFEIRNGDLVLE